MTTDNFQDSNYGSLGGFQSSSSSFTMSLSESEADYLPSTSGCSSDLPYPKRMQLKEKRKEQVKKYLKQLKSMVPHPSGNKGEKMGTLSALQHVVDSFKKIKEDSDFPSAEKPTDALENELNLTTFEGQDDLRPQILETSKNLFVTVALPDLTVMHISNNLKEVLGYPQDAWNGRCLDDFVHRCDIVTMKSSIAINRDDPDMKEQETCPKEKRSISRLRRKIFYFRLRQYKALNTGYNIQEKGPMYKAFQTCVSIGHKPDPTVYSGMDANDEFRNQQEWLILRCTPLKSVYEVDNLPDEEKSFHTRHNLFCSYSHIEPKALSMLGFLPQDVIGKSIFNFYHVDDMELLYNAYQQVVMNKKVPFKSMPHRFRMRNGGWVYVETEWSSFVNPWTHKMDFVIGKHSILKGQKPENIFNCPKQESNEDIGEKALKYQSMIRKLLLQPLSGLSAQFNTEISQNVMSSNHDDREEKAMITEEDETAASIDLASMDSLSADISRKMVPQVPPPAAIGSTQQRLCEEDVSVAYEQLNYTSNIKRFLLSQPNSFSPSTFKKSPSSTDEVVEKASSDTCDSVLEVDISVPKPPSFGSSTKVLVSEQEQREDVASIPAIAPDLFEEGLSTKEPAVREVGVTSNTISQQPVTPVSVPDSRELMSLTQKTLFEHTRQQEELFIQEAKQDHNLMVLKRNYRMPNTEETSSCLKRSHSPDSANRDRQHRAIKTLKCQDLSKQHGLCAPETAKPGLLATNNTAGQQVFLPFNIGSCPQGISGIPLVQVDPANLQIPSLLMSPTTKNMPPTTLQSPTSMQWPYYPQSGVSFIPQVMSGFFQSSAGIPINTQSMKVGALVTAMPVQNTTASVQAGNQTVPNISGTPPHTVHQSPSRQVQSAQAVNLGPSCMSSSDFSSSFEETSSSLYYMLESGSHQSVSSYDTQQDRCSRNRKKNLQDPPWLLGVKWSSDIQMRYRLPKQKKNMVLKKDREIQKKFVQSELIKKQFCMFEEEVTDVALNVMDEEADDLFWPEYFQEAQTNKSTNDLSRDCCGHSHGLEDVDISVLFEDKITQCMETDALGKDSDTSQSSSADDDESSCKFSDLTPSDERSNEELGSSIKESDASSSDQGSGGEQKDSFESEGESASPENDNWRFDHFFKALPVEFASDEHKSPPWIKNAIFNDAVSMEYCLPTVDIQKQLQEDREKLANMYQSDTVLVHMNELMENINHTSLSNATAFQHPACDNGTKQTLSHEVKTNSQKSCYTETKCSGEKTVNDQESAEGETYSVSRNVKVGGQREEKYLNSQGEISENNLRQGEISEIVDTTSAEDKFTLRKAANNQLLSGDVKAFDVFFDSLFTVFLPNDIFLPANVASPESIHDSFMEEVD